VRRIYIIFILVVLFVVLVGSLLAYALIAHNQTQPRYTNPTFTIDFHLAPARGFNSTLGSNVQGTFDLNVTEPAPLSLYVQEGPCSNLDCTSIISSNPLPVNVTMIESGTVLASLAELNFTNSNLIAVKNGMINCNYSIFLPQSLNATEYSVDIFVVSEYTNGTLISGINYPVLVNVTK
jgi:hypothetical protein